MQAKAVASLRFAPAVQNGPVLESFTLNDPARPRADGGADSKIQMPGSRILLAGDPDRAQARSYVSLSAPVAPLSAARMRRTIGPNGRR